MGEREGGEGRQEGRAQSPAIVRLQCRWFVVLLNALAASAVLVSIVLHCRVGASGPLQNSGTMLGGSEAAFPIKQHLSSVTRYDDAVKLVAAANVGQPNSVPDYCRPVHLNLLARHGSRNPTKKRINEMNWLVHRLKAEVVRLKAGASREYEESRAAKKGRTDEGRGRGEGSVAQAPTLTNATRVEELGWIEDYRSPWKGGVGAGYLVPGGEEEMFGLAQRLRARFPEVFSAEYDPDVYSIHGTQVPRAASSAVAFGLGLFEGQGQLGTGRQRAFAVVSDTKETDRRLRFHKTCPAYEAHKKAHKPAVRRIQSEAYRTAAAGLRTRYGLNLSADDAAGVWLLCKQEAALLGQTQRACSLLAENEVALLEWADDVEMHQLKGYGAPINYRMARPLLQDVVTSMERAAAAAAVKAQQIPGSCAQCERDEGDIAHGEGDATQGQGDASPAVERARLRFAHAETVVPLACILGLFMENVTRDLALVAAEERLPTPPRPPHHRAWHGSLVAPFGANTAIVLFDCGGVERAASQGIATQRVLGTARSDVLSESRSERLGQRTECGEIPPGSDFGDDDEDGDLENGDGAFQGASGRGCETVRGAIGSSKGRGSARNDLLSSLHDEEGRDDFTRTARGSRVSGPAPQAGGDERMFVVVLHNEVEMAIPGCGGRVMCPWRVFLSDVVGPHLRHSFERTCQVE